MDAETTSVFDTGAEYQVEKNLKENVLIFSFRERLTDLGGPTELNGGAEELGGLEVFITKSSFREAILQKIKKFDESN